MEEKIERDSELFLLMWHIVNMNFSKIPPQTCREEKPLDFFPLNSNSVFI